MKDINIFCFGFGQVAKNFIKKLSIEQYNINLSATSRSESSKKIFNGINYNSYLFNSENFDQNFCDRGFMSFFWYAATRRVYNYYQEDSET